ncbi:hypothetical protein COR50_19465 [Chitinophaga caeni]|uniref:DUF3823 domain-containing protein n=1 Tax=Chitinophaga caeni TaxID=2029983 RepID=A0A291QZ04_9BACT|nr:DUF3823 domain-containing protein [Chitinophaga caeni]ATL49177.1 hypothetical protein COR50_19465 [Chitinophaga caeni]
MKSIKILICFLALAFAACEKDNYDGPTAGLSGRFIDVQTGELVQQDIIRGTTIEILEHGYENVQPQYLVVKNDGTYANTMLFANTYTITPVRGNFIALKSQDIAIKGQTTLDFEVTPYIRIKDVNITRNSENTVLATFKLEQNVINNVKKIGLYVHTDSRVGEPMRLAAQEVELNAVSDPDHLYSIEMNTYDRRSEIPAGKSYYFRVGALIDIGEAKFNYYQAQQIDL